MCLYYADLVTLRCSEGLIYFTEFGTTVVKCYTLGELGTAFMRYIVNTPKQLVCFIIKFPSYNIQQWMHTHDYVQKALQLKVTTGG